MEKVEQFIGKKYFKLFTACVFIILPLIIYCVTKYNIAYIILSEVLSLIYTFMIIINNYTFQKKYFFKVFNLTLCCELLLLLESFNIFKSNIIALILILALYTIINVLHIFLYKNKN